MADSFKYAVILRREPEGGFTVLVPALPEVVTYGRNEAEALANAREAVELAVEYRIEVGDPIPDDVPVREVVVTLSPAA